MILSNVPRELLKLEPIELLFPYTDAYKAAFDLYVLEQRGMIIGAASATELILETIKTRTPENPEP